MFITCENDKAYFDVNKVLEYHEKGLLKIKSYSYDKAAKDFYDDENGIYAVLNYTIKAQFDRLWDEVTLSCRGLVVNMDTGEVISRVFPKFFNNFESDSNKFFSAELYSTGHTGYCMAAEKYDGSMVSVSAHEIDGEKVLFISSRSTLKNFVTDAARKFISRDEEKYFEVGKTHMFELISKEDPHIVKYDFEDLVYLGTINNFDGSEYIADESKFGYLSSHRSAKYRILDFDELIAEVKSTGNVSNSEVKEGFVAMFADEKFKFYKRVKVKFDQYFVLHKMMSDITPARIFELIQCKSHFELMQADAIEKTSLEILSLYPDFPDEFYESVRKIVEFCIIKYYKEFVLAKDIYDSLRMHLTEWRDIMIEVQSVCPKYLNTIVSIAKYTEDRVRDSVLKLVEYEFKSSDLYEIKLGKFLKV